MVGMSYKVLVPLDGSPEGEVVFGLLQRLSKPLSLDATLLRCYEPPSSLYGLVELEELARLEEAPLRAHLLRELEQQAQKLTGFECRKEVVCGHPAAMIQSAAEQHDLVMISSRGRGGFEGWLLGSVTTKVVRTSSKPVLVVGGRLPETLSRFLVCLDGSEASERALDWALELASAVGASLVLYRFFPHATSLESYQASSQEAEEYLAEIASRHQALVSQTVVKQTDGPGYIAELADELQADIVFLGSRGQRSRAARWLLGSVAEDLVHHASCPVMVVP